MKTLISASSLIAAYILAVGISLYPASAGFAIEQSPEDIAEADAARHDCEAGDLSGCFDLAWMYANGVGVDQDYDLAALLYLEACSGGDAQGCTNLGRLYETGRGVETDSVEAVRLYRRACEGRDPSGCNNLGAMYQRGEGVEQNDAKALPLYEFACEGESPSGCANLGEMYRQGIVVEADPAKAAAYHRKACVLGDTELCTEWLLLALKDGGSLPAYEEMAAFFGVNKSTISRRVYEYLSEKTPKIKTG